MASTPADFVLEKGESSKVYGFTLQQPHKLLTKREKERLKKTILDSESQTSAKKKPVEQWMEGLFTVTNQQYRAMSLLERYLYHYQEFLLVKDHQLAEWVTCGLYQGGSIYHLLETTHLESHQSQFSITEQTHCLSRTCCMASSKALKVLTLFKPTQEAIVLERIPLQYVSAVCPIIIANLVTSLEYRFYA